MTFTPLEIADFCWKNRKTKAFKDFTYEQILEEIIQRAAAKELLVVEDQGAVCAVCVFSEYPERLYIHNIVATGSGFLACIEECRRRYQGWQIIGTRSNKTLTYKIYGRRTKSAKTS